MKRQLFTSILCVVLLLVMLMATTLAWFTDQTYNVNTMVAGKISIEQKEYSDADHRVEFENNKFVMMPSQTVVKEVVVTNTGNQDCYVRTLFAFEDSNTADVLKLITVDSGIVIDGITNTNPKVQFTVTKDGKTTLFTVGYYVHATALAKNEKINPLSGITLKAEAKNAWHEAVGNHYEVFVLSQATQTAGLSTVPMDALDTAFNPISAAECAKWFAGVLGGTADGNAITIPSVNP